VIFERFVNLNDYVHFVSHDIRAPLRHIKALSMFINEDYGDILDDMGKEYIRKISTTCDDAETMINELLELAKIRDTEIAQEVVNMNDVIREVEVELEFFLKEHNGRLEVVDNLPSIPAHRSWLKDLFVNLITNGITYNNSDEKVLRIGFEDKERDRVFYVADNGMGIEDTYKEEIFKPFKRAHSGKKGTGLGLTICRKVVEAHGGKIWVESEPGKGSTFFCFIV
jgi:chemotaxis family two-component system sensor kinase Cph1